MFETKIAVCGAAGRMGKALIQAIGGESKALLALALEHADHPALYLDAGVVAGRDPLGVFVTGILEPIFDVLIDFSLPDSVMEHAYWSMEHNMPIVIGTTGFSAVQLEELDFISTKIPLVLSGNYSVGVNVALDLVRRAAQALGSSYDVELMEIHHRHKFDVPSGTALMLGTEVAQVRGVPLEEVMRCGRPLVGVRTGSEIGMHSVRGGDVVGEHQVWFMGDGERVEIRHVASTRLNFAQGAVRAALWVASRSAGRYSMRQVLGLD